VRAALVERLGEAPVVRELAEPEPRAGELLLEIAAAPLNPIDLSMASGRFYAGAPETPYVPGVEGLGRVLSGEGIEPGTRVYVESGGGRGGPGSCAERVAVERAAAIEVPEGADDALAACLGVAGLAAWLPLEWRARLQEGESVLVLGASGAVGQLAVQAARLLGAGRIVAAARDAEGLERARALGADATVDLSASGSGDELGETLSGSAGSDGFHVVLDPLWGEPAAAAAKASTTGGRIVQLGQSAGAEATLASATVRGRALSILGYSNFLVPAEVRADALRRVLEHAAAGRLTVEREEVPLAEVDTAWQRQAAHPHRKLVLRP
jgi:NADPH:quinone reductase